MKRPARIPTVHQAGPATCAWRPPARVVVGALAAAPFAARKVTPDAARRKLEEDLPTADRGLFAILGFVAMILADALEAARPGPAATAHELGLSTGPLGFRFEDIAVPM